MSDSRREALAALRRVVVPLLRERGFKGSVPHFRRLHPDRIDLLTIQFSRWGGEFVVEIASAPPSGVVMHWGEPIPPEKVTAHHVSKRLRLGSSETRSDHWFKFDHAHSPGDYDRIVAAVLPLLDSQAEPFWREA